MTWSRNIIPSCYCSVAQLCLTATPKDCSTPGSSVLHYLLEFAQIRVHRVSDAIQPSHPLSSPSPPCLQSFPASGSFQMSQFFTSGGQRIRVSASASVLPMNIQDWSPLGWTGWISLQSKGLSRIFSSTTIWNHQFFGTQPSLWSNSHPYMTTGKTTALTTQIFIGKVMSLRLLILWLQSLFAVILEPKRIKPVTASTFSPSVCHELMESWS